ncbi:hypothetical protein LB534_04440 [Mesorhizobium sp. CA18]|uniref:hypothetical protein n=1 Tax=unclassified Mesorhizobium TaxID=325217 RepID=UPI001CCFDD2F|nr:MULTISPECIES: hypothetical protein [unclassified Mesorhizobium]MBZ9734246.1 hypothetical protein [Mesorhizobium sp. CA9]MBZ9766971.1 hypothetical protein [Mesorhizobium sp. CA6]MBZ9824527.1 hypothetical protein [Mesorhizobium sp. CA18]MBZ9829515.1 hypothetical protein [Mesorhizobium sp. CA2]MBZ9837214.1 hypothetical protein [Mesorhizobium sp. CA3]
MAKPPVLENIVRQHAEMAAFLWAVYDWHLLNPDQNPDMDEVRMGRLVERLDAHLDGLRIAGEIGRRIAEERLREFPEAGELFVVRMLSTEKLIRIAELDLNRVRTYLAQNMPK